MATADHFARLAWARQHLDTLEAEIAAFLKDGGAYFATVTYDAQTTGYVARIRVTKDPLFHYSLRVGDIVHNMRSSLDNLAYALALKHSGIPTEQEAKNIQFLICDTKAEFTDKNRARFYSRFSPGAVAELEKLQPFNTKPPGFKHPLSVVRDLDNIDKHRHILIARTIAQESSVRLVGPDLPSGSAEVTGISGPFEDGTIIARWKYAGVQTAKVDVRAQMAMVLEFGPGPAEGGGVTEFLDAAHKHIRNTVIPAFAPHL